MATTKKPEGLTITRKGNKFIFQWKKGESYGDGQQLQYHFYTNTSKYSLYKKKLKANVNNKDVPWSATHKTNGTSYTVTAPSSTCGVIFRVRGNHDQNRNDPGWSDWAYKSFDIDPPKKPTVTATWDSNTPNKTVFAYTAKDDDNAPFSKVEYRTKWVTNYNGDPAGYSWSGTPSNNSSKTGTIFNSTETVSLTESKTRIVECRSVGMGGASEWVFKQHTYAKPNAPVITSASASQNKKKGVTTLNVAWTLKAGSARPVDKTTIEYCITAPDTNMTVPAAASWTQADTPVSKGKTAWAEEISSLLSDNDVLFVRIKVEHDTRDNYSNAVIALVGKMSPPSAVSITPDQGTHTIVVNATNDASAIPDSYIAISYRIVNGNDIKAGIFGIIAHGLSSTTITVPPWTGADYGTVGVFAVVGTPTLQTTTSEGVKVYTIDAKMTSPYVVKGTMDAPTVTVTQADIENTATVAWDWVDEDATSAEVSWADHPDAWESTDEPKTYVINSTMTSSLNVSGLEAGIPWYFRVRLITEDSSGTNYGIYSNTVMLNLASAPSVPVLEMSEQVIDTGSQAIASWVYISTDNTLQAHATIAEVDTSTTPWTYTPIIQADSDQRAVIDPEELGWSVGDYLLAVQVESESGRFSEWSDPVPVTVADPLVCTIANTSLTSKTLTIDGNSVTFQYALTDMPMTVEVTGAGDTGQTVLMIKRKADYTLANPDETQMIGYADELVCQYVYTGEASQTITIDDVEGKLNDEATYYIEAMVTDNLGRMASARYPDDDPDNYFTVLWDDQAIMPDATASIIDDEYAELTINKPAGWQSGDTVDIYRMTADKPQLIAQGIQMSNTPVIYADPYPALGDHSGYIFVYKTKNGDTVMSGNEFAWLTVPLTCRADSAILDFNGRRVMLGYNLSHSNGWEKEFQTTRYLGGSIQGDWTAGVSRTGSIESVILPSLDPDTFKALRNVAEYNGICHVRTCDGSVMTANVELEEDMSCEKAGKIENIKLSFTRVDPVELDGQLLSDLEVES